MLVFVSISRKYVTMGIVSPSMSYVALVWRSRPLIRHYILSGRAPQQKRIKDRLRQTNIASHLLHDLLISDIHNSRLSHIDL